jgi:predicted aspartyl protease
VDFNDRSSRLLLDTGASGMVLKRSIAEKAGIVPVIHSHVGGIGDAKDANTYLGYADKIRIGDLEFHDCLVTVTDKAISGTEDGLIGADVFSRYLVDIDFQYQKLRLSPLPKRPTDTSPAPASLDTEGDADQKAEEDSATKEKVSDPGPQDRYIAPEMQSYSRVLRFGHILLIPTKISDSSPKLFAIDSGAQMNGISPKVAREVTKVRDDYNSHLKGMSGEVSKVYSADQAVLQFSHFRQENQDVTSWDLSGLSKNLGTEVSGILGFTTLHLFDMKIDYRDGLVDFGFDAKAFKH